MSLTKKVAIITGSSSGIGAHTAIHFASLGYCLVLTARDLDKLNAVAKKCKEAGLKENEILVVQGFLEKTEDLDRIIDKSLTHFNRIDVLINNAANAYIFEALKDVQESSFENIMKVNVWAPIYLTKLAAPHLSKTKGCVLNCSSIFGQLCPPDFLLYGMSKAALSHFTRIAAQELGPSGIRIITVSPGPISTPVMLRAGFTEDQRQKFYDFSSNIFPLRRVGDADEVARIFAFLASKDASLLTGIEISVDGGASITSLMTDIAKSL